MNAKEKDKRLGLALKKNLRNFETLDPVGHILRLLKNHGGFGEFHTGPAKFHVGPGEFHDGPREFHGGLGSSTWPWGVPRWDGLGNSTMALGSSTTDLRSSMLAWGIPRWPWEVP